MPEKPKKKTPWSEWFILYFIPFGACLIASACLPNVYWRYNRQDSQMLVFWPSDRKYSIFTVTDKTGARVSWMVLYNNICMKYTQMAAAQISLKGLIGAVAAHFIGGAALGCPHWPMCRDEIGARCITYRGITYLFMANGCLMGCGACCAGGAFVLRYMEKGMKKSQKKKIQECRRLTMISMICGFILSAFSVVSWVLMTDQMVKRFRRSSYYPYPWLKGPGFYLAAMGVACFLAGMLSTIYRWDPFIMPCWAPKDEGADGATFGTIIDNDATAPMAMAPMAKAPMAAPPPGGAGGGWDDPYDPMGPPPMGGPGMGDPMGPPPMGGGGMGGPPGMGPPGGGGGYGGGGYAAPTSDDLQANQWG